MLMKYGASSQLQRRVIYCTLSFMIADSAYAQSSEKEMAVVQVTGSADAGRREATVAKAIVTREEMLRFGDNALVDVLRRVPGVTVVDGQGRGSEVRMRGLGAGYTQILINGEPAAPGFSLDSIPPSAIERIEVSRVATADASAQAMAGSINLILKQVARKAQSELKASLAGYGGNPSVYLDAMHSDKRDDFSYVLQGGLSRDENTWPFLIDQQAYDPAGAPTMARRTDKRETGTGRTASLTPRLNWKLGNGDSMALDGLYQWRGVHAGTDEERSAAFGKAPLYASDILRLNMDTVLARTAWNWSHRLPQDAVLDVKLVNNYNHRKSRAKFDAFDSGGGNVLDERTLSEFSDVSWTLAGKYRTPWRAGHAVALGWDVQSSQRDEERDQRQRAPAGYPALTVADRYEAEVTRLALFAQDEWDFTQRSSIYAGLRWEGLRTDTTGTSIVGVRNRSSVFSPVLQLVWKLPDSKSDQVRVGLSRTYKAPNTRDLMPRRYVATDNTATTPDLQGNPALLPELAWGADVAYEHYLGDAGLVSVSGNVRDIKNVIVQELSSQNDVWLSRPVNAGDARVAGVEFEGKANLAKLAPQWPALDVRLNLARNWSEVRSVPGPHNRLDKQTPASALFGLDYGPPGQPWRLGSSFSWQQGGPVRLSRTQRIDSNARRILDAYGSWRFHNGNQLRLSISNMLHENTILSSEYFSAEGSLRQTSSMRNRTVARITLEIK
ncbi:TonB-dependent receptor plug domain-containing protein [Pseudoduganella armeniaca]|uniref:TonB-dependent receptor n=1 Tax=Pseudoduganella armeniaca TaxID=2072590 RepID=A0A2R4CH49_9BURK|nr:TonB-dependent receptor [Pseudoduganella armeniaca]AVR98926.1 hypothetical protein C9I28_27365 [Pseudoduganella armeniaca]